MLVFCVPVVSSKEQNTWESLKMKKSIIIEILGDFTPGRQNRIRGFERPESVDPRSARKHRIGCDHFYIDRHVTLFSIIDP